jgi:hypothetical protein
MRHKSLFMRDLDMAAYGRAHQLDVLGRGPGVQVLPPQSGCHQAWELIRVQANTGAPKAETRAAISGL